jgi:YidC/Oxa1 family membrane protein insertase
MDKNQATGLLLFAAVILVYSLFFASAPEPLPEQAPSVQTEAVQTTPQIQPIDSIESLPDSVQNVQLSQKFGVFAEAAEGSAQEVTLENQDIKVVFLPRAVN